MNDWHIFRGDGPPHDGLSRLPAPPPWRDFAARAESGEVPYRPDPHAVELVNAALYLRRPLLVTGPPGAGKSTLAAAVARELNMGPLLVWPINSRSTLAEGLYHYDALAHLRDLQTRELGAAGAGPDDIGRYVRLGPLGTALYPRTTPRALLIDEIDKSDIDLPNDLLHAFERGEFEVPELVRRAGEVPEVRVLASDSTGETARVPITGGRVRCGAFPFVVITSNGERELPPPFLRRCLRLDLVVPDRERLRAIVEAHLGPLASDAARAVLNEFVTKLESGCALATDQLLNAVFLINQPHAPDAVRWPDLRDALLRALGGS